MPRATSREQPHTVDSFCDALESYMHTTPTIQRHTTFDFDCAEMGLPPSHRCKSASETDFGLFADAGSAAVAAATIAWRKATDKVASLNKQPLLPT